MNIRISIEKYRRKIILKIIFPILKMVEVPQKMKMNNPLMRIELKEVQRSSCSWL